MNTTKRILKYKLETTSNQSLQFPIGSAIIDCKEQNGALTLWVLQDTETDKPMTDVLFKVVATGEEFELENWHYLRTVIVGEFVWHIFMRE